MHQAEVEKVVRQVIESLSKLQGIPVGVSARHIHLSQQHVETLFGAGHKLTPKKELMGGQYAAAETVTLVGLNLRAIENVRVLGPTRVKTQVEVSATDAVRLGLKPPVRESGDLNGSAAMAVVGPVGVVHLMEGCIIAARHIHMSVEDAKAADVKDGGMVSVTTEGVRSVTLNNVRIRVHPTYTLEMHVDTDEANASGLKTGDRVKICKFVM